MTTTDTYAALCKAIDDGDNAAMLALADWLEEGGHIYESARWRSLYVRALRPFRGGVYQKERWIWQVHLGQKGRLEFNVHRKYFDRMTGFEVGETRSINEKAYSSRFGALDALVRAELEDFHV